MLYRFVTYLKFIFSATNQHGVHSPFIYSFVTQCLYRKKNINGSKSARVFYKCMDYFKAQNVYVSPSKMKTIQALYNEGLPEIPSDSPPFDLVYLENPKAYIDTFSNPAKVHNDTMVLLDAIHRTKETSDVWETVKQDPRVKVTVDMFFCGAVFFRKQQAKEHFKIRI